MKGDARAARRIYLRFNRSKRAGDRLLSIIAHIRLAMLRRWLDELALSHNVEAMPDGAFDGPTVGADLLSHATTAYWSCKVAQNGGAK